MPRLLSLLAVGALLLSACDATRETPSTGAAGPALAIDSVRVTIGESAFIVTGLTTGTPVASTDSVVVDPGATYAGQITMADDLLAEIRSEAESYLVTFSPASDAVTVTATDRESQYAVQNLNDGDYPLGLSFRVVTDGDPDTEVPLTVRLHRFDGVAKTSAPDPGGVVDVEFTVPLVLSEDE